MDASVRKYLHQGEVDLILKRERDKRRKDRILNVRHQARIFAKEVRVAVKNESINQLQLLESQIKTEWLVQRKQRIEELGKVYGDCLRNIGQGHENAIEEDRKKQEKESVNLRHREMAAARGTEAARRLRTLKAKQMDEVKRPMEQRELVKAVEKERARAVCALPKKPKPIDAQPKKKEPEVSKPDEGYITRIPGVTLPPVLIIKSHTSDQVNAAMAAEAIEEMNRVRESEEAARKREKEKKAQQRFIVALKNERIRLEYVRLMSELEQLEKEKSSDISETMEDLSQTSKAKQDIEMSIEELFREANLPVCTSLSKSSNGTMPTLMNTDLQVSAAATESSSQESCLNHALLHENIPTDDANTDDIITDEEKLEMQQPSTSEHTCSDSPSVVENKFSCLDISPCDESIIAGHFNGDTRTFVSDLGSLTILSDTGNSTTRTPVTGSVSSGTISSSERDDRKHSVPFPRIKELDSISQSNFQSSVVPNGKFVIKSTEKKSPIEVKKLDADSYSTSKLLASIQPVPVITTRKAFSSAANYHKAESHQENSDVMKTRSDKLKEMLLSIIAIKQQAITSAKSETEGKSSKNHQLSTIMEVDSLNFSTEPTILHHEDNDVKQYNEESSWMNYQWDSNSKISALSNSTPNPRVHFPLSVTSIKDLTGAITLSSDSSSATSQPSYSSRSSQKSSSNYTSTPRRSTSPEIRRELLSGYGISEEPDLTLVSSTTLASITESDDENFKSIGQYEDDWSKLRHDSGQSTKPYYQERSLTESLQSFLKNESMLRTPELLSRGSVDESLLSFLQHEMSASSYSYQ